MCIRDSRCAAAVDFFVVGPSGFVRVCNHSPVELNHIDDIDGLRANEYWKNFSQKQYLPSDCYDCHERHICDGGCREAAHIVGGSVCSPDVLMSERRHPACVSGGCMPKQVLATKGGSSGEAA